MNSPQEVATQLTWKMVVLAVVIGLAAAYVGTLIYGPVRGVGGGIFFGVFGAWAFADNRLDP